MNNIQQIVLGVLKSRKVDMIFDIYAKQTYPELNGEKMIKHNAKIYIEDLAKSISDKIKAVSIDREEVKRYLMSIFGIYHPDAEYKHSLEICNHAADKILSLLKPVETLDRDKVEKIMRDFNRCNIEHDGLIHIKMFNSYVDEICNLAMSEVKTLDKDKVINLMLPLFKEKFLDLEKSGYDGRNSPACAMLEQKEILDKVKDIAIKICKQSKLSSENISKRGE